LLKRPVETADYRSVASVSHIPRARATQRLASLAVYGASPAALVGLWWLRSAHLIADTSLWVLGVILAAGGATNLTTSLLLRAHPTSRWCTHARVAASTLVTAATVYAVGWGSLLLVAYAVGSAELLRTVGPDTTRPNLIWNWVAIGAGELAVEAGWAPSVVDPKLGHAVAISGAILLAIVTRVLGESARATEVAEDLVRARALHFEALIEHASDLIGVVSADGVIISVSPAVTPLLGYTPAEVAGRPVADFIDPRFVDGIDARLGAATDRVGEASSFELWLRHKNGGNRLVVATLTVPSNDWSNHIVLNVHDVTTQRDLEQQLRHDARHDALTGLLNRKAFGEATERSCARASRSHGTVGLLYIDLDGFKQINDTFGHDAGDRVLVEAGHRLRDCLGSGETVARLGGDEFAVLVDAVHDDRHVELAESILDSLGRPIDGLPNDVRVGASIGIALRSTDGIEISTLMQDADAAMYTAKRKGRARWEINERVIEV